MKRACLPVVCLLIVLSLSLPALAAENGSFETAGDLWEHWCENGCVPDYISGVWSTDGGCENLTFGLVPGEYGDFGKAQILSLLIDDSTVTFVTQRYSRNYLLSIVDALYPYFERDIGFTSAGPSEYENVVHVELHTDFENDPESLAAVAELEEAYGDAISISFTDTVYHTTLDVATEPPALLVPVLDPTSPASPLPLLLLLCSVLVCAIVLTEQRRRRLLTHIGAVNLPPLSPRQVEERVRDAVPEVPRQLVARIDATLDDISGQKS